MNPDLSQDLARIADEYQRSLAEHGDGPAAVRWADQATQERRMEVLLGIDDLRTASVLDFGCGTGHLLSVLRAQGFEGRYLGIDLVPEMVEAARAKHPDARFECRNILERPLEEHVDHVLVNGTFNNRSSDPFALMTSLLEALWPVVDRGLAFNLMSTYVDFQADDLAYFEPEAVFAWCKAHLSPLVALRHDYRVRPEAIPYEFAIYVRR